MSDHPFSFFFAFIRDFMHAASHEVMRRMVKEHLDKGKNLKVLDVGSLDVNGTYRDLFVSWDYTGLDLAEGSNVTVVARSAYDWGLPDESFDVVVSGNVIEHVQAPWLWFKEASRVLKKGGLLLVTAPVSIGTHRYPVDCYRYMSDGLSFLMSEVAGLKVLECAHIMGGYNDVYGVGQ